MQRIDKEYVHGQLAVEAARIQGIFPNRETMWNVGDENDVNIAKKDIDDELKSWQHQLEQSSFVTNDTELELNDMENRREGTVLPITELCREQDNHNAIQKEE